MDQRSKKEIKAKQKWISKTKQKIREKEDEFVQEHWRANVRFEDKEKVVQGEEKFIAECQEYYPDEFKNLYFN